jgi:hypothetical protein
MFLTYGIVALLLVGGTIPPSAEHPESGASVVGEPIDVRDLQAVITEVLDGDSQDRLADVNEDGRVDILDLQFILVEASETQRPVDQVPSEGIPEGAVPTLPRLRLPTLYATFLDVLWDENQASQSQSSPKEHIPILTKTERYLYTLMPNAPPPCA